MPNKNEQKKKGFFEKKFSTSQIESINDDHSSGNEESFDIDKDIRGKFTDWLYDNTYIEQFKNSNIELVEKDVNLKVLVQPFIYYPDTKGKEREYGGTGLTMNQLINIKMLPFVKILAVSNKAESQMIGDIYLIPDHLTMLKYNFEHGEGIEELKKESNENDIDEIVDRYKKESSTHEWFSNMAVWSQYMYNIDKFKNINSLSIFDRHVFYIPFTNLIAKFNTDNL